MTVSLLTSVIAVPTVEAHSLASSRLIGFFILPVNCRWYKVCAGEQIRFKTWMLAQ